MRARPQGAVVSRPLPRARLPSVAHLSRPSVATATARAACTAGRKVRALRHLGWLHQERSCRWGLHLAAPPREQAQGRARGPEGARPLRSRRQDLRVLPQGGLVERRHYRLAGTTASAMMTASTRNGSRRTSSVWPCASRGSSRCARSTRRPSVPSSTAGLEEVYGTDEHKAMSRHAVAWLLRALPAAATQRDPRGA